jgi:hypothetical protein
MRTLAAVLFLAATLPAAEVTLTKQSESVKISVGDEVLAVYNFGPQWKKPFLLPVSAPGGMDLLESGLKDPPEDEHAPGNRVYVAQEEAELKVFDNVTGRAKLGEVLTVKDIQRPWLWVPEKNAWIHERDVVPLKVCVTRLVNLDPPSIRDRMHPAYYDHPHHKGVWLSIDEVNDIKFWAEEGVIRNAGVELVQERGNPARFRVTNHWLAEDGQPLLIETTTISVYPNRLFTYDIEFKAGEQAVTFNDTKEGLFAIRVPNSMREYVGNGPVVSNAGVSGTKELWGKPAPWIDYVGPVAGRTFGVTVMDHPGNLRPSRYHVRDYGLFAINPFGERSYTNGMEEAKPVTLQAGQALSLRYGLYVHGGDTEEGGVKGAYEQFLNVPARTASAETTSYEPLQPGEILVANGTGRNVVRIDAGTGRQTIFAAGDKRRRPLDVLPAGRVLVVDEDTGAADEALQRPRRRTGRWL